MSEKKIKEEEIAAKRIELLQIAKLVSVPSGEDETTFQRKLDAFVKNLPAESALQLVDAYNQVKELGAVRGLATAGLAPADMILGAVFGAAQKGKSEVSAGEALGAALPAQPSNLRENRVEV